MKAALYKEFRLTSPLLYLFLILGAMVVIPNYPKIVGVLYCLWGVGVYLQMKRDNRDFEFSATLPIPERKSILSVILFCALFELAQVCVAAVFAPISNFVIQPEGNAVGLDPNITFFGAVFMCLAAFNVAVFPLFYKRGYKIALGVIAGGLLFAAVYIIIELTVGFVPELKAIFDTTDVAAYGWQSIMLIAGILMFAASVAVAYKLSCKSRKA